MKFEKNFQENTDLFEHLLHIVEHFINFYSSRTSFGSSIAFLVQDQHIHKSISLVNMLAKTFFYIFLIH